MGSKPSEFRRHLGKQDNAMHENGLEWVLTSGTPLRLRQYRYWITKWCFDKKVKTHEMKSIVRIRQKRKLIEVDMIEQRFVVRGQEVADGKIDRFMKNHGIPQSFLYSPPSLGRKLPL